MSFHVYDHESDRAYVLRYDRVGDHACDRDCDCSPRHAHDDGGLDHDFLLNGHENDGENHSPPHRGYDLRDRDLCWQQLVHSYFMNLFLFKYYIALIRSTYIIL